MLCRWGGKEAVYEVKWGWGRGEKGVSVVVEEVMMFLAFQSVLDISATWVGGHNCSQTRNPRHR